MNTALAISASLANQDSKQNANNHIQTNHIQPNQVQPTHLDTPAAFNYRTPISSARAGNLENQLRQIHQNQYSKGC